MTMHFSMVVWWEGNWGAGEDVYSMESPKSRRPFNPPYHNMDSQLSKK